MDAARARWAALACLLAPAFAQVGFDRLPFFEARQWRAMAEDPVRGTVFSRCAPAR